MGLGVASQGNMGLEGHPAAQGNMGLEVAGGRGP